MGGVAVIGRVVHWICCAVAFVLRMCGRYVHVGEKRADLSNVCPGLCEPGSQCAPNPEGRYIDRYALIGGACTNEGVRGWLAKRLGINVWLQRIWRPDADRNMHDHPWHNAGSIVLCGGYREERAGVSADETTSRRSLRAGFVNLLPHGVYHRITHVQPYTWTLFVTSRPHGFGWGFLVDGEHVDHDDYLSGRYARVVEQRAAQAEEDEANDWAAQLIRERDGMLALPADEITEPIIPIEDELPPTLRDGLAARGRP